MSQTSVTVDNEAGYEGRDVYPMLSKEVMSKTVGETAGINFGRASFVDTDNKLYLLRSNSALIALSGVLVASNSVACSIVVNGVTTALTATVFSVDHATTMAAIETKLEAVDGVLSATVSGNNITILADPETDVYVASFVVTLGAGQATATLTNTCSKTIFGVPVFTHVEADADGNCLYADNTDASVAREIYIEMVSDDALAVGDSVFVRFYDETATAADKSTGMLMGTAGTSGGYTRAIAWTAATVYKGCSAAGRAVIRVRI